MKAVIYARYSSDSQREESIEGQLRECTAFAEKNGITILRHYIDRAFSAKTDNRPEFQAMIKDSSKKLFDMIIVWKLDRFARNRYDSARYKAQLKKNGVKVVSATETISDGAEGILLESMLEGMAEYYSADLAEKVVRGMTENALKCKYNGGTPPLGYVIDSEQYFQIDPLTAPFVLEAFKRYDEGATMTQIRDWLNEKGIKNTRRQEITYNSIQHMLNNRRYIGEYSYREVIIPDGIPAIVPKDLFDRVQEKMAKNKKAPARHKAEDDYLLTTKLFCGYCGAYLCGESGTSRTGLVHHYYKCVSVKKKRAECHKKPVKKQWIEDLVVDETMKMVMDDKAIEAIVSMLMELQNRESSSLPLYEKELKDTEAAIDNMLNAIQQGIFNKSTKARLDELEAAKDELENMIACEKLAKPKITEEQMMFWLHRFRKLDVSKKEHRQMLINTFVNAIYLYDDKMLITFNYKDGTKTITFDEATTALANKDTGSNLDCLAAPNTEAPVGCLCVWLSQTGLEAGGTKRSCGAFCPAGERKQSGRAARSASSGMQIFVQHTLYAVY
ncbi:MAG: recombinase family protein [Christensenellales bacterium]